MNLLSNVYTVNMETTAVLTVCGLVTAFVGVALGFLGHYLDQPKRNAGEWKKSNRVSIIGGVCALIGLLALLAGTVIIPYFN